MSERADQITANEPSIVERLQHKRGGAQAGNNSAASPINVAGNSSDAGTQVAFSTSLSQIARASQAAKQKRIAELGTKMGLGANDLGDPLDGTVVSNGFDIWVEGTWIYADRETDVADLGLFYVGVDYRFNSNFLVGLLTQFDWTDQVQAAGTAAAEGRGWFEATGTLDINTGLVAASNEGVRGRIESGVELESTYGFIIRGEGFYDGIGADDFEAYGGSAKVIVPLN